MYRSLGIRLELCSEDKNPNETLYGISVCYFLLAEQTRRKKDPQTKSRPMGIKLFFTDLHTRPEIGLNWSKE